ncbi:MAG TPA: baseplate J/gp47 family protein, partial [Novosphingobium sp.]|nr:baseplate J/gp47 family protein [Novosphingobium sp.]
MPYSRPSLSSLRSQVQGDIDGNLPGLDTLLRYANLRALGAASAGVANGCYGYLDYIAKQSNPFTATGEALAAWGALKNVYLKEATAASGAITFAATAGTTTPIPAGTTITRADGATFTTTAAASPSGTSVIVQATATTAGAAGNTAAGTAMYLSVGLSGITPNGSVSTAFTGGADVETQDDFKSRVLVAYQEEPSGGSVTDYENWALAVSGVTRAWCVARAYGPGTVVVLFMMDEVRAAENGFPQGTNGVATSETRDTAATGDQLLVANALFSEEPAEALVYAFTPTP